MKHIKRFNESRDNMVKVVKVSSEEIEFEGGMFLYSDHDQDCCESHYLSFDDLGIRDFEGLEFDLTGDSFFKRIPDYGIHLIPVNGHPIPVPGYGSNNGYYSDNLKLVLTDKSGFEKYFDITECQKQI